jgi:hypothetical protein
MLRTGFLVLDLEARHWISEPEMPRLRVIGSHAEPVLGFRIQFVKQVRVDAHARCDNEITISSVPFEILVLNTPESNPPGYSAERGFRGPENIHGQAEIMGKRIGRAHGKNCKRDLRGRQHLNNVVDSTVAAAGEYRVAPRKHGLTGLFPSMSSGVSENKAGLNAGSTEHAEYRL